MIELGPIWLAKSMLKAGLKLLCSFWVDNTVPYVFGQWIEQPRGYHIVASAPLWIVSGVQTWCNKISIHEAKLVLGWNSYEDRPSPSWKTSPIKWWVHQCHPRRIWRVQEVRVIGVMTDYSSGWFGYWKSGGSFYSYHDSVWLKKRLRDDLMIELLLWYHERKWRAECKNFLSLIVLNLSEYIYTSIYSKRKTRKCKRDCTLVLFLLPTL